MTYTLQIRDPNAYNRWASTAQSITGSFGFSPLALDQIQESFFNSAVERTGDETSLHRLCNVKVVDGFTIQRILENLESPTTQVCHHFIVPGSDPTLPQRTSESIQQLFIPVIVRNLVQTTIESMPTAISSASATLQTYAPTATDYVAGVASSASTALETYAPTVAPTLANVMAAAAKLVYKMGNDHIVAFVVDFSTRTIEFYDPKGWAIKDREGQPILNTEVDLSGFLTQLVNTYGLTAPVTVLENPSPHQTDRYNCGVFVGNYYLQRSQGKSAKEIFADTRINTAAANTSLRLALLNLLYGEPPTE